MPTILIVAASYLKVKDKEVSVSEYSALEEMFSYCYVYFTLQRFTSFKTFNSEWTRFQVLAF